MKRSADDTLEWRKAPQNRDRLSTSLKNIHIHKNSSKQRQETCQVYCRATNRNCKLNKHMSSFGMTENAMCRICETEEQTLQDILCQCEGLDRMRVQSIGELYPDTATYMKTFLIHYSFLPPPHQSYTGSSPTEIHNRPRSRSGKRTAI